MLTAAGSSLSHLVKTTIFYADVADFPALNAVYERFMPDPPPARSAPANVRLPRGLLVSIEAIAAVRRPLRPGLRDGPGNTSRVRRERRTRDA